MYILFFLDGAITCYLLLPFATACGCQVDTLPMPASPIFTAETEPTKTTETTKTTDEALDGKTYIYIYISLVIHKVLSP